MDRFISSLVSQRKVSVSLVESENVTFLEKSLRIMFMVLQFFVYVIEGYTFYNGIYSR